jgi:gas vesicle protein
MSHRDDYVKGLFFGTLVGMLAGVLIAPKSGSETRAALKRRSRRLADDLNNRVDQLSYDLGQRVGALREVADDMTADVRERSGELITKAENLKQDLQTSATKLADNGTKAKAEVSTDVKRLISEGSDVMNELENLTRDVIARAKQRRSDGTADSEELPFEA